jgi:hypothetical protein
MDPAMITKVLAALAVVISLPQIATAGEWRYCLAPSHSENTVYMSPVFPTDLPMGSAESDFGSVLQRARYHYDDVQCPLSDNETSALAMQRQTIDYNRQLGNRIVDLPWRPRH